MRMSTEWLSTTSVHVRETTQQQQQQLQSGGNQTASEWLSTVDVSAVSKSALYAITVGSLLSVIACGAIVGNVLVIISVLTNRKLRTITNRFVVSLASADLMVGLVVLPPAVKVEVTGTWRLGATLCDVWTSFDVMLCTASILNLCCISLDRYLAVTRPLQAATRWRGRRLASAMIGVAWIAAVLITCPPLFGWREADRSHTVGEVCSLTKDPGYIIYSALGSFYVPLAVMLFVYANIFKVVRSRLPPTGNLQSASSKLTQSRSRRRPEAIQTGSASAPVLRRWWSSGKCSTSSYSDEEASTFSASANHRFHGDGVESAADNGSGHPNNCGCLELEPITFDEKLNRFDAPAMPKWASGRHKKRGYDSPPEVPSHVTTSAPASVTSFRSKLCGRSPSTLPRSQPPPTHHSDTLRRNFTPVRNNGCHSTPTSMKLRLKDHRSSSRHEALHRKSIGNCKHALLVRHPMNDKPTAAVTSRHEAKTAKTLAIVVGCFVLCWLPFFVVYVVEPFCSTCHIDDKLRSFCTWLGYANSVINPFIYAAYNPDFRHSFWHLTFGLCGRLFRRRSNGRQSSALSAIL